MLTTKEVINMTYEGLPTAARNVSHAVDFKIAVSLGLERVYFETNRSGSGTRPKSSGQNVTSQQINLR